MAQKYSLQFLTSTVGQQEGCIVKNSLIFPEKNNQNKKIMSHSSTSGSQSHTHPNETDAPRSFPKRQDQTGMRDSQMIAKREAVERLTNTVS